jgi:hypothetical protein
MKSRLIAISACCFLLNCENEPLGSSTDMNNNPGTSENFVPSSGYWVYDVNSISEFDSEMNFTATDSVYVDEEFEDYFSLSVNDDGLANGSMNMILTNGNLYNSPRKLVYDGSITLPENLANLGLDNFILNNITLVDLDAENEAFMYFQDETITNTFDIQDIELPIDLSYEIFTSKTNYHDSININGDEYLNVFEGKFVFSLSVTGTFTLFGFPQTVSILEPQNIITTSYYYVESIGLVRAESEQGFELSSELSSILSLLGVEIEIPTSFSIQNVEQLAEFELN